MTTAATDHEGSAAHPRFAEALRERFGAPRIAAAGLLVVGIGLMLRAG